jgi:hypothetical protein
MFNRSTSAHNIAYAMLGAVLLKNSNKMTNEQIREHLLKAGVKNLKEFGYPEVTTETILTDEVYKMFFKSMLEDNLGNGKQVDEVINQLLLEVA